jgi:hypothetical protein
VAGHTGVTRPARPAARARCAPPGGGAAAPPLARPHPFPPFPHPTHSPSDKEVLPTLDALGVTVLQGARRYPGNKAPVCPGGGRARRVKGELCCDCHSYSVRRPKNDTAAPDPAPPADGAGAGAAGAAGVADGAAAPLAAGFSSGSNANGIKCEPLGRGPGRGRCLGGFSGGCMVRRPCVLGLKLHSHPRAAAAPGPPRPRRADNGGPVMASAVRVHLVW